MNTSIPQHKEKKPTYLIITSIFGVIVLIFFAGLVFFFVRTEQRFNQLNEKLQGRTDPNLSESEAVIEQQDPFQTINTTYGPVPGRELDSVQLDWKDSAHVQELRILDDDGIVLIALAGDDERAYILHPYIVGSVPEGIILEEGQSFERLILGESYHAELKGEVDGEPFDIGFDFNVP